MTIFLGILTTSVTARLGSHDTPPASSDTCSGVCSSFSGVVEISFVG